MIYDVACTVTILAMTINPQYGVCKTLRHFSRDRVPVGVKTQIVQPCNDVTVQNILLKQGLQYLVRQEYPARNASQEVLMFQTRQRNFMES